VRFRLSLEETLPRVVEAGAIAYKIAGAEPSILLVRAKKNPGEWIFPKGHIEQEETAERAAARELQEEAGVIGERIAYVGALEFRSGTEDVRVEYYLFKHLADVAASEERETRWCRYDEALRLLSFKDAAELLTRAFPIIIERHESQ
jgi:8-oxo-dGTP pyrophosphatase MutT (NUDIX family)